MEKKGKTNSRNQSYLPVSTYAPSIRPLFHVFLGSQGSQFPLSLLRQLPGVMKEGKGKKEREKRAQNSQEKKKNGKGLKIQGMEGGRRRHTRTYFLPPLFSSLQGAAAAVAKKHYERSPRNLRPWHYYSLNMKGRLMALFY